MFQHRANGSKRGGRSVFKDVANGVRDCRSRLQLEELEQRQLLSVAPAGAEFRVNTYTTSYQDAPSVASDAAGDYVVAWESFGQDGSAEGVYAQRYNAAGVAQGGEFRVNTYTTSTQTVPSVAMDSAGDFVVVWQSYGQDGSSVGIYAQRYNAAGVAQGSEFQVNTYTTDSQAAPSVAMDSAGDFVVAWNSFGQDGWQYGVYAQRYNAAGVVQGSEFQVNTYTTQHQVAPSVAMDTAGDFVVAWNSGFDQDGSGFGVYAQRYNAAGAAQGSEFRVNTYTTNNQFAPLVAMDAAGDFVVAWDSAQDGSGYGVYAQRYNAAGAAQGGEFQVNTYTTGSQLYPSVAMDCAGDFVVAWESAGQDGSGYGVYAQRYNAAGVAQGSEFRVNTYTTSDQGAPSVAMDSAGDIVIAWVSVGQDGDSGGVYAQRYAVTASSVVGRDLFYAGSPRYDLPAGSNPQTPYPFSDDNAIATDKSAYLPGSGAATYANVSNYDRGINGIMVDLDNTGSHTSITLANILDDFTFKVGNNNSPGLWAAAPLPTTVTVRPGAGAVGSDRVELIWADNAIQQQWIEVTVKATANTGLAADDHFFFGSEIGNTGSSNTATKATTTNLDVSDAVNHGATIKSNIPLTNFYDFSRDGNVNSTDVSDAVNHGTTTKTGLNFINIGPGGPFAPDISSGGVASALASSSTSSATTTPTIPPWIVNRLAHLDLNRVDVNHGPLAKYFEHLAHEGTPRAKAILVAADHIADTLGLDDILLDAMLVNLGLE